MRLPLLKSSSKKTLSATGAVARRKQRTGFTNRRLRSELDGSLEYLSFHPLLPEQLDRPRLQSLVFKLVHSQVESFTLHTVVGRNHQVALVNVSRRYTVQIGLVSHQLKTRGLRRNIAQLQVVETCTAGVDESARVLESQGRKRQTTGSQSRNPDDDG